MALGLPPASHDFHLRGYHIAYLKNLCVLHQTSASKADTTISYRLDLLTIDLILKALEHYSLLGSQSAVMTQEARKGKAWSPRELEDIKEKMDGIPDEWAHQKCRNHPHQFRPWFQSQESTDKKTAWLKCNKCGIQCVEGYLCLSRLCHWEYCPFCAGGMSKLDSKYRLHGLVGFKGLTEPEEGAFQMKQP